MTVSSVASSTTILGNSAASVFSFAFIGVDADDISVTFTDTDGTQTVLTSAQYTLSLNAPSAGALWGVGGTVTYPTVGSPIATGTSLTITRTLPLTQTTSISNQGDFYPTVVEQALDVNCMQIQQVAGRTGQIRGTWATAIDYNFGDIVQDGANGTNTQNYYTCAIANTSGTWATDLAAGDWSLAISVQQVSSYATAAAASATAANNSAIAAASSESNAQTADTDATAQAVSATASAATATAQAGIATAAATSATSSAAGASSSASTASAAQVTASAAAVTATTQASNAATSATNAATSAANANTSALIASGSVFGTSTTSNSIGTGSKTYTTQSGLSIVSGGFIVASDSTNPANYNHGQVTSYSGTSLVINVLDTGGSGTLTSWNLSPSGPQGAAGAGSGTVNSGTAGRLTYYAGTGTTVSDNLNLTVSSGALTLGVAGSTQGSLKLSGSVSSTTTLAAPTTGTGTMTLQAGTDTLVGRATTDTLTNKTLTAPIISTISNTGTVTLFTATDTVVGRATTDTLTNKTLDTATSTIKIAGTSITSISGNTAKVATTSGTLTFTHLAAFDASGNIVDGGANTASAGLTQLATNTPGTVTSFDFSSISASYNDLVIQWSGVSCATSNRKFLIKPSIGAVFGGTNVTRNYINSSTVGSEQDAISFMAVATGVGLQLAADTCKGSLTIHDYASTTAFKKYTLFETYAIGSGATTLMSHGYFTSTSAIDGLRMYWAINSSEAESAVNFDAGTVTLYGRL